MHKHYWRLLAMTLLSFLAMYALMYAMVDRYSNALPNLNQAYMAGLMTAAMVGIELLVMGAMYADRRLNAGIFAASSVALVTCWGGIRAQSGVSDEQFLKSMIPHHAGAILMCERATLRDPSLDRLCDGIVASQQREIDFMKQKLRDPRRPDVGDALSAR
ncbi:MAG TPA: DUF305 domain-containing protein [Myxococcota bacterium]|nr:DUF305 domain-containing protein [Myxococcota bacterium]